MHEDAMSTNRRNFLRGIAGAATVAAISASAEEIDARAATRKTPLADDPLRPQYHLLPAKNWMNDPNGPIYWKGKYHMFFQYNPKDAVWGDMHWAHSVSEDMIHWKHLPIAMAPTPGGPDQEGVFSGTAFVQEGRVGMMFTGVKTSSSEEATIKDQALRETQCLAIANDDDLSSFSKLPQPVMSSPPKELQVNGFRDPSPWRQGEWWYTPIGSGIANTGGAILLYRSRDLHVWEYVGIFAQREPTFEAFLPWDVWECPEFFALGDRHVLIFSTMGKAFWQTGRLDEKKMVFHADKAGILDYGSFYAPKTQLDAHGNRILWGWIQEARPTSEYQASGWAGMMSLPRVMTIAPDGTLRYRVADAAKELRRAEQRFHGVSGASLSIADCCGEALYRLSKRFGPFGLDIKGSREDKTWMSIGFDPAHPDQILIDSRPLKVEPTVQDQLEIQVYIDGSVIELLIDHQIAWTKRFYYPGEVQSATLHWRGSADVLKEVTLWTLDPITRDRLTT